jgi:hypothetical protein
MKYVILLTACINPDGMAFTKLTDPDERKRQYIDALNYYAKNTSLPIVFAENSNTDIRFFLNSLPNKNIEILTFDGNHDKIHGKGYGEAEIIEYAVNNSKYIDKKTCIIKITGRLIINNIKGFIRQLNLGIFSSRSIICSLNSDYTFADSRIIIAPCTFYLLFLKNKDLIDDNKGVYFENVLCTTLKEQCTYSYFPFLVEPQVVGISGSLGIRYEENNQSLRYKLNYLIYRLQQQRTLTESAHLKKLSLLSSLFLYFIISLYKLLKWILH